MHFRQPACAVLASLITLGAALPATLAGQGVRVLAVELDTSRPVGGARWSLVDSAGRAIAIGMARGAAALALNAPAPGVYALHFAAIGFEPHTTPRFPLDTGAFLELVHVARPAVEPWRSPGQVATAESEDDGERVLAGTVRDAGTHDPVRHAQATARFGDSPTLSVVMSDARAQFRLPVPSGGPVDLSIRALGYTPARLQLPNAHADLDIRLEPNAVLLAGRTTTAERVRVMGVDARSLAGWIIDETTIEPLRGITQNVGDMVALRALPGVTVSRNGECIRIRRLPCVLIVMNEVPIGDVTTVPVESVRSMVLLRPVEAMNLFGSRAFGGALVIRTR